MFDKIDNFALIIIILLLVSFMSTSNSPIQNEGSVDLEGSTESTPNMNDTYLQDTHNTNDTNDTAMNDTAMNDTHTNDTHTIDNSMDNLYNDESGGSFATVDFSNCNSKSCERMKGYHTMNELNKAKALNANDLKPHEKDNVPWDQPHEVLDDNIIEDRIASIGIATKSSSLRNANLQIRPDPQIQHQMVGPWNMSTITPDYNRKSLC